MIEQVIDEIELRTERLKQFLPSRKRLYFKEIPLSSVRGALVYGLRGVGKTTFLLETLVRSIDPFLYLSADHPRMASLPLYDVVQGIFKRGYKGVVIDEVHHAHRWSAHLKALYDDYPDRTLWISDSSNIILRKAVADLSRRFVQFRIPLLSFREYLYLEKGLECEKADPFEGWKQVVKEVRDLNVLKLFQDYIQEGIRPFYAEGEYCARLKGLLEKSIYHDIPFYVSSIQENHLKVMNAIVGHLLDSPVPTLNVSGMCSEWELGKEKLYQLLHVMEQSELIHIVRKSRKPNGTRGAKIFLSDPSLYSCFRGNRGSAREAFVVMCLRERFDIYASPDEQSCDFVVDGRKVEVGGKRKVHKDADFVLSDEIDVPVGNRIPLWLLGFLW
ncbi:MAG: AAA family ATPase [Spirochaetes bacterium]|nr:AAA family ATPase [Spirochaetota bacterium]